MATEKEETGGEKINRKQKDPKRDPQKENAVR